MLITDSGLEEESPSATRSASVLATFDYFKSFYSPTRRHSLLGYFFTTALEKQESITDINVA